MRKERCEGFGGGCVCGGRGVVCAIDGDHVSVGRGLQHTDKDGLGYLLRVGAHFDEREGASLRCAAEADGLEWVTYSMIITAIIHKYER